MNGRAYVIASGLLVTATGAALVGSATAAATSGPRTTTVRRHHETRPTRTASTAPVLPTVDPAVRARSEAVAIARWVETVNSARWYAAVTESLAREAAAAAAAPRPRSSGDSGNILECIKRRESDGQYDVVNSSSGAAGAYQFMPGTWDNTARAAGRPDLVGVNPSNASPADQDAMAQFLMSTQGLGPWGGGCG